jgi:hypothetical protein
VCFAEARLVQSYALWQKGLIMKLSQRNEPLISSPAQIEPLVDEYEFSRITGRGVASARRDRLLGQGCPYIKLGALVRYRPEDIRSYIQSNQRRVSDDEDRCCREPPGTHVGSARGGLERKP